MTTTAADRVSINRAPKGGAVSPVNGRFYAGGQFMPLEPVTFKAAPAPLEGSSRQVLWAARLRREALALLETDIRVRREMLAAGKPFDEAGVRRAIRRDSIARHRLMAERSAPALIERRAMLARP